MKLARRKRGFYFTLTECIMFIVFYSTIISIILLSSNSNINQVKLMNTIQEINKIKANYNTFTLKYGKNIEEIEKTIIVDTNFGITNTSYNELTISNIPLNNSRYFSIMNLNEKPYLIMGTKKNNSNIKNDTLTPLEAFIIDNKLDDGIPNKGKIRVFDGDDNKECYYNNYYNTKNNKRSCTLISIIE